MHKHVLFSSGEHCWPNHGKTVVGCAQILHLFSALVLYLLLISDFLNDIWPHPVLRPSCWTAIAGILVFPSVFINDLSRISWLSMFSVFALLFVFTSTIGYSISEYRTWDLDSLPFFNPEGFPIAWCIILFSFVSHPYLPSVEEKMKSPERFPLVMNICYAIAMIFKIAFGTLAVFTFKTETMQEVSENLPFGPLKSAIDTFLGFNGMFSYALPSFALINIIDKCNLRMLPPCYSTEEYKLTNKELCVNSSLRILLVMLSVIVAIMVPEFSLLMAVVGSVSAVALVLVFPALFHLNLMRSEMTNIGYVIDVSIIVIGFFSTIFGLFFSVKKLVNVYHLDFL
jgi:vesicular inhibitory amino acid transporter